MGLILDDVIRAVDKACRSHLKTTPEHTGFGFALERIAAELGPKSPVLEVGDDRAILKLDRASLVAAIEVELERPCGKRKMAERIADGISDLVGVHALELDRGEIDLGDPDLHEDEIEEELEIGFSGNGTDVHGDGNVAGEDLEG